MTLAAQADKHRCYEQAVQCVEAEIDTVDVLFKNIRGYLAEHLREDFCGTAQTSLEWLRRRSGNRVESLDLDTEVLAWAKQHRWQALPTEMQQRWRLHCLDVRDAEQHCALSQIVLAMNFSYQLFATRAELLAYFSSVYHSMTDDGVFFLDAYGGSDSFEPAIEETECDGFTYVWEQANYDPVTGLMQCYIHFHFADGSRLHHAFSYRWRMWTLPELRELLREAGFVNPTVYWEGEDENGEGNGVYSPVTSVEQESAWVCYLSAEK